MGPALVVANECTYSAQISPDFYMRLVKSRLFVTFSAISAASIVIDEMQTN